MPGGLPDKFCGLLLGLDAAKGFGWLETRSRTVCRNDDGHAARMAMLAELMDPTTEPQCSSIDKLGADMTAIADNEGLLSTLTGVFGTIFALGFVGALVMLSKVYLEADARVTPKSKLLESA